MRRIVLVCLAVPGVAAAAALAAPAPQPTVSVNPPSLVYGESTTIAGTLSGGPAQAGKAVTLRQRFAGERQTRDAATVAADAGGNYSFVIGPTAIAVYTVVAATSPKQQTNAFTIPVRTNIGMRISDRTPRKNKLVRFTGLSTPALDGLPVLIQRRTASGAFATVARTRLGDAGTQHSQYNRRLRIGRAGTYRVSVPATRTLATGASIARVVRVHR